jgi:hypothetical protein
MRDFARIRGGLLRYREWLAGAPGFEPGNAGIKIRCLTTWLRPNQIGSFPAPRAGAAQTPPLTYRLPVKKGSRLKRPERPARARASRSVAQPGSAPASGAGGRRFKSCRSDQPRFAQGARPSRPPIRASGPAAKPSAVPSDPSCRVGEFQLPPVFSSGCMARGSRVAARKRTCRNMSSAANANPAATR